MTSVSPKVDENAISTQFNIFDKKVEKNSNSFIEYYRKSESKLLLLSTFELKSKVSFSSFQKIQNLVSSYLEKIDSQYKKKQQINLFIDDSILSQRWDDLNDFLKNGVQLNLEQNNSLNKILFKSQSDNIDYLFSILKKKPLYGVLAEYCFFDSSFQIYCSKPLSILSESFTTEHFPTSLLDEFDRIDIYPGSSKTYKGIKVNSLGYDIHNVTAAINMHNLCINPSFSMKLFVQVLHRSLNPTLYKYASIQQSIINPLNFLYTYLEPYLTLEDKKFITKEISHKINKKLLNSNIELEKPLTEFLNKINKDLHIIDPTIGKDFIIKQIKEVYRTTSSENFEKIINYKDFEKDTLLPEHIKILSQIEFVFKGFIGKESLMINSDIEKVNHLICEVLPSTIKQYKDIDLSARSSLTNIQGKTAEQLMTESLNDILETTYSIKRNLEQSKIDKFSINARKLKN